MSKAAIIQRINSVSKDLAKATEKLAKLQSAQAHLDGIPIDFEYIPQDAISIKGAYQLYGTPYDTMATNEEELVTQAKAQLDVKKEIVSGALKRAIAIESTKVVSCTTTLTSLRHQLAMAKD